MPMSLAALFLASTQGALFGPSKYGLLPEILPENRLSWGNGVIELGTFLAAIAGTVVAGQLPKLVWESPGHIQESSSWPVLSWGWSRVSGSHKCRAADPAKKFQFNFLGDLWSNGERIAAGPRAVARRRGQHVLLFSWRAAAV